MSKNFYHYPLWVRLWHLANAVLCLILIITGLVTLFGEPSADDQKVSLHGVCGILLTVSYAAYLIGNLFTENGKQYFAGLKKSGASIRKQIQYYFRGHRSGEQSPFIISSDRKFNPLQQVTYIGVMYVILPVLIITGWAMLFNGFVLSNLPADEGSSFTDHSHVVMGFLVFIFLFIHIYISTMGKSPLSNFRSIITGWHESQ